MDNIIHVSWTSPSNIALIKYWGKRPVQMPMNSSISLTLSKSYTKMSIKREESTNGLILEFIFENNQNEKFKKKIYNFLTTILNDFPWLSTSKLTIESSNTFPHSSGIASSASSMSALALCLLSLDELITNYKNTTHDNFLEKASSYARLASGSACRSIVPNFGLWKKENTFAVPCNDIHPLYLTLCDSILIIDETEKNVSSSAGHSLMENHPYNEIRYNQAENNLVKLLTIMKNDNFLNFSEIVENEALSLHALMMTSTPSVILLKPESLEVILKVKEWRLQNNIPITFTIDAGPNIHLLYPERYKVIIQNYINNDLWKNKKVIHDKIGDGPRAI